MGSQWGSQRGSQWGSMGSRRRSRWRSQWGSQWGSQCGSITAATFRLAAKLGVAATRQCVNTYASPISIVNVVADTGGGGGGGGAGGADELGDVGQSLGSQIHSLQVPEKGPVEEPSRQLEPSHQPPCAWFVQLRQVDSERRRPPEGDVDGGKKVDTGGLGHGMVFMFGP